MMTASTAITPDQTATLGLNSTLKKFFGFEQFKGNQEAIIRNLVSGHDTFVLMPTGGGKSLCYQLPSLIMEGTAIVISPLIALMKNQVDAMRQFGEEDDVAHFLNSSLSKSAADKVRSDILSGHTKLLYVAPESLTKEENIEFLKTVTISFYAIDEAHCISEWGHDFRPEYRKIRPIINEICRRPIIALTATATPKVQHDIQKNLGILDAQVFKSSFNRQNLYYEIRHKTSDTEKEIIRYIKNRPGKSGIIYCLSRKKVEELADTLKLNDIPALPYHAGMDSATRSENQDAFIHEKVDVIVATIAFGMGIDKPDVRFVIHYDMPKSLEGYYQETGRAGRDGGEGECITFYSRKDLLRMEKFMQGKPVNEQEIGKQLLQETAAYAESSLCRRKMLLHYFGEQYDSDNCGNCDNCRHPKQKVDSTEEILSVLEIIASLGGHIRHDMLMDILHGRETSSVKALECDYADLLGSCVNTDAKRLQTIIRQGIISGYITRDIDNYGMISLTSKGRDFLAKPGRFYILEDNDFKDDDVADHPGATCAADMQLFAILKNLRKSVAQKAGLPSYIIFQDQSLEAMATFYPVSMEDLVGIPGVGEGKAKKYGKEFLELISRYVKDNDIERPLDVRVKTQPNKSKNKLAIINAIDRMIPLDEVADSKGMEFDELLEQIESIVFSGCKLDIRYFLNDVLDDDIQDDILSYFKESESEDIEDAVKELGDDYTEEEIRLVRIRFFSEYAN